MVENIRHAGYLGGPPGSYRATFEDRLIKSDLVFLRSWAPVEIPKFCNMVTDLLFTHDKDERSIRRNKIEELEDDGQQHGGTTTLLLYIDYSSGG